VVSLVHDADEASHVGEVAAIATDVAVAPVPRWTNRVRAVAALPTHRPLTLALLHAPSMSARLREVVERHPPDVVFAFCSSMARYAMEPPLAAFPFVLDMVDVDSAKWRALGASTAGPLGLIYRREARCLAAFERQAICAARITLAVNRKEVEAVRQLDAHADARVLENGIDVEAFTPTGPASRNPGVVFCGVLDYAPNEEAALRLGRDLWPAIRQARPDARLTLVGAHPTRRIRELASDAEGIVVTGRVPDVRPYLWDAAVAAVPLRIARGLQNKVLEALAAGLPTIVSPVVAEGLPASILASCRVATDDTQFVAAIVETLNMTPEARRSLARAAPLVSLGWDEQLRTVPEILREAIGR
jgi:sugar transferase (PEP-CTERM/EpsH1 system associated)